MWRGQDDDTCRTLTGEHEQWNVGHLAVLVVHPERDAGTGQQQQGLLLGQLLPQTFNDFGSLVGSLESRNWAENTSSFCRNRRRDGS